MADELDLDVEKSSGKKKMIIIIVAVVLLLGIGVGAALFLMGGDKEQGKDGEKAEEKAETPATAVPTKALYMKLSPVFVVNFENPTVASYLQMDMQVMAREQAVLDAVQVHLPVIRNNIILLLSTQRYEDISTVEGKDKLRADVLKTVQDVLQTEIGKPGVEAVYFTSMIMQ